MKFQIHDVVIVTSLSALLIVLTQADLRFFVAVTLMLFIAPLFILLAAVLVLDQRGTDWDLNSNPLYRLLKKCWLLALTSAVLVWAILFVNLVF